MLEQCIRSLRSIPKATKTGEIDCGYMKLGLDGTCHDLFRGQDGRTFSKTLSICKVDTRILTLQSSPVSDKENQDRRYC